jgi:hypothetical protein
MSLRTEDSIASPHAYVREFVCVWGVESPTKAICACTTTNPKRTEKGIKNDMSD